MNYMKNVLYLHLNDEKMFQITKNYFKFSNIECIVNIIYWLLLVVKILVYLFLNSSNLVWLLYPDIISVLILNQLY